MTLVLLLGGARSGKSALAVRLARQRGVPVWFVATGEARDGEMADRIRAHRATRPSDWQVIEVPREVERAVEGVPPEATLIIDGLTLWVSNLLEAGPGEGIPARAAQLAARVRTRPGLTVVVSDEVGMGLVPVTPLGRTYRDLLGQVNACWASAADEALLLVAGRTLRLEPAESLPRRVGMAESPPVATRAPAVADGPRTVVVDELRGAAASLTFLTRLPLGNAVALDGGDVARSAPYFPLVGAGIGGAVGAVALATSRVGGPLLAGVVGLVFYAGVTGALHFDGVADTFDALGTRSREDALRVMHEPTIGTFGATALFLDLFLWFALLATLVVRPSFLAVVLVVGTVSRLGPVLLLSALPYVRPSGGRGSALSHGSRLRAAVAVGVTLAIAFVALGLPGLLLGGVMAGGLVVVGAGFRRWLGGVTGDTLGCSVEVLAVLGLGTAVVLLSFGAVR